MYKIENTINLHKEQSSGAYRDKTFWPYFQEDINNFKCLLKNIRTTKSSFSLLRIGHSELSLFNSIIPNRNKVGNLKGRHSNGNETKEDHVYYYESLLNTDYITTQIGYDFKEWINLVVNYKDQYLNYKNKNKINYLLKNINIFN